MKNQDTKLHDLIIALAGQIHFLLEETCEGRGRSWWKHDFLPSIKDWRDAFSKPPSPPSSPSRRMNDNKNT